MERMMAVSSGWITTVGVSATTLPVAVTTRSMEMNVAATASATTIVNTTKIVPRAPKVGRAADSAALGE